ncbi:biopolymer transporter ExbD [Sulfitobacter delicatus]|uniref:Outer membrane transport energization protein ExbD n=1 Tax=Sulfitobacter delicatus TaxID=218672 RepID=A0A1G7ULM6_9RHOB|nr:biopolymer transporter ExbD [Sulfitobacter delicatus]SDG48403.1 outer membrane transport energization protein ExbD [Sulfitobacter delicatus]
MARPRRRRNRLSMTSLIDVIFLLLLFFMLTSTFSKFSEIELTAATSGGGASADAKPYFLQLGTDSLRLNGEALTLDSLTASPLAEAEEGTPLLISLAGAVESQRLAALLIALRALPALRVTVLEG